MSAGSASPKDSLTLCVVAIRRVLGQLLQVVSKQHLVAGDALHGGEHVVLQRQVTTHLHGLTGTMETYVNGIKK